MSDVWRLYESHAGEWDGDRTRKLFERSYLDNIMARLATGAAVLDLGCGGGEPVARYFLDKGFALTGVDAARAMIALCKKRFADATWIEADMRTLDLDRRFDAIIAWDSFFHLEPDDQRAMFAIFADHIAPRGLLLFTSGPEAGEAVGDFYGEPLFHASLGADEYRELLASAGFSVLRHVVEDPDCSRHTVWLARSERPQSPGE